MVKNKFALGFVLYKPHSNSIQRIINYANLGYKIYIYINSINAKELILLTSHKSLNLFFGNANGGLAKGLTVICNAACNSQYKTLLYFDQDTVFENKTLDYISSFYDFIMEKNDDFHKSIVSTTFRDLPHYSNVNHISSHKNSDFIIENVYFTINSGSLYFLEKFKDYKWFDDSFFVDGVDYSFCINSIKNNYTITEIYHTPGIDHKSEQGNLSVWFFKKLIIGRTYPLHRNIDFVQSHLKLIYSSFGLKSSKAIIFLIKSLFFYLFQQALFRINNLRFAQILTRK